jgi:hypothetical protein
VLRSSLLNWKRPAVRSRFTVFARRNRQGHTVLVWFYNDVDQFYCAWKDGYQIRSMVGVRRALGLDWEM